MVLSACIHIVLPIHNRLEITREFIHCLNKQTYTNFHLILLDDGSTEDVAGMAKSELEKEKLTILTGTGDWWWGGALDYAFKWIKQQDFPLDDIVFICNNDVRFNDNLFELAVKNVELEKFLFVKNIFLCDNKPNGKEDTGFIYNWQKLSLKKVPTEEANVISTRGLFSYMKTFLSSPGFHPNRYRHYLSDYAFTMLAYYNGIRFKGVDDMFLYVLAEETSNVSINYKLPFKKFHRQLFKDNTPHHVPTMVRFIFYVCRPRYIIVFALIRFLLYTVSKYVYFVAYKFKK